MKVGLTGRNSQYVLQAPASREKIKICIWDVQLLGQEGTQNQMERIYCHRGGRSVFLLDCPAADSVFLVSISHFMKQPVLRVESSHSV